MALNFRENDSTIRRALKDKLFFKSFDKISKKNFVLESPCKNLLKSANL